MQEVTVDNEAGSHSQRDMQGNDENKEEILDDNEQADEVEADGDIEKITVLFEKVTEQNFLVVGIELQGLEVEDLLELELVDVLVEMYHFAGIVGNGEIDLKSR